ncbi:DNA-binding domain-containing protein, AraC-type [Opitutaceae bacterium TAV1]|nr:AraC family transcriptional regulator [Opitutaceae bacterium TAV5]EIP97910.1 DNA-binding domain-containing protein, AraC-type [Opitutaceae bacterium TAV1]
MKYPETTASPDIFRQQIEPFFAGQATGIRGAHLAGEPGHLPGEGRMTVLDVPRLSLCIRGTGRYRVRRGNRFVEVRVRAGEVIFVAPGCGMEPVDGADYLSLGIVFHPQFTLFAIAERLPGSNSAPWQRFMSTHHCPHVPDTDGAAFCEAAGRARDPRVLRRLAEIILLEAVGLLDRPEQQVASAGKGRFTWRAACQFVQEHLQHPITRQDVADYLHVHPNHISRLFSRYGDGISFNDYVLEQRLRRARVILAMPGMNISDIAHACGFGSGNYFARCFRKKFGHAPGTDHRR